MLDAQADPTVNSCCRLPRLLPPHPTPPRPPALQMRLPAQQRQELTQQPPLRLQPLLSPPAAPAAPPPLQMPAPALAAAPSPLVGRALLKHDASCPLPTSVCFAVCACCSGSTTSARQVRHSCSVTLAALKGLSADSRRFLHGVLLWAFLVCMQTKNCCAAAGALLAAAQRFGRLAALRVCCLLLAEHDARGPNTPLRL